MDCVCMCELMVCRHLAGQRLTIGGLVVRVIVHLVRQMVATGCGVCCSAVALHLGLATLVCGSVAVYHRRLGVRGFDGLLVGGSYNPPLTEAQALWGACCLAWLAPRWQ